MELQKMWVTLALKSDDFKRGLGDAQNQAEGFASGIRGRVGGAMGTLRTVGGAALLSVGAAAVGGFGMAMGAAIDMNASLEQSTMQFTTLMGDADAAQDHVAMLFDFAAKTPFESAEIIAASKHLQVFGGDALNTRENLTLVGDAAAAVGAPFDEVAFWTGRMYSAMQGGQPFGEAAARLQELGIMAPETRQQLEAMQASGASGTEMWSAYSERMASFSGSMEMQATSWAGLTSTITDNLTMAAAVGLKPFFDLAMEGLGGLATWLSSDEVQAGIQAFAQRLQEVIQAVASFVTEHVIPFVQSHGPELKGALAAIGIVILATVLPAVVSLVAGMLPLIAIVGAVMAVGALLAKAWNENWGDIQGKTAAAWDFIRPKLEALKQWIQDVVIPAMRELWEKWTQEWWPAIQTKLAAAWEVIRPILQKVKDFIVDTVIPAVKELWEKWTQEWWPTIQTVLENVWTVIEEIFGEIGRWINDNIVPWVEFFYDKWVNVWWPEIRAALEAAWEAIQPVLQWLREKFETVMGAIGEAITPIKVIWDGFVSAVQGFWDWISNKVFNFEINLPDLPDWAIPGSPLPIHTGWLKFAEDAGPIGEALSAMFEQVFQPLTDAGLLLEGAGTVGGIAGQFQRQFERDVLEPMAAQMEALDETVSAAEPLWKKAFGFMNAEMVDWKNPANFQTAMRQLVMLRNAIASQGPTSAQFLSQVDASIQALIERNDLNGEYVRQQERLLALEKARADLDFLKSQLELLNLIKDNKLDTSILDGLTFGLGADAGDLMDTMVEVMQQLIRAANAELRIHSPSQVAMEIGRQWNAGLAAGLMDTRGIDRALEGGLRSVLDTPGAALGRVNERGVDNSRRTVINGGVTNILQGRYETALDEMEVLLR